MAFLGNLPDIFRSVFDDGLDEVLIFAVVFIVILLSGNEDNDVGKSGDTMGILPLIVIGIFILLYAGINRKSDNLSDI